MNQERLSDQVSDCRRRARELVAGLTPDELMQRADPASWSIAECLSHLNLTGRVVQAKIAAVIERGRREKITGQGPFSVGPLGRLAIWIAEPPPKFRIRATPNIAPKVDHGDCRQVFAEFTKVQDEWERLAVDCEGLDQKRLKVPDLFPRMPALRLAAPIPWMMAHQRRHLWQAENVKRQILSASSISAQAS